MLMDTSMSYLRILSSSMQYSILSTHLSRGQLRMSEEGKEKHAFLKADGKYDLDTLARGNISDPKV